MLCVIAGHSVLIANTVAPQGTLAETVYHVCFTFHMPLFFIVSGYFMHPERPFRWRKESRELIATYAVTAALIVLLNVVWTRIIHRDVWFAFAGWLKAAVYGAGDIVPGYIWPVPFRIGALWFLLGLFWAHLIVHMAFKTPCAPAVIAGSFIVGYWSAKFVWLPFSVQSGMTATAFVYFGVLAKRYDLFGRCLRNRIADLTVTILAALVWILAISTFAGFSMAMNQYGPGWRFWMSVAGAIAGTYCVLRISVLLDRHAGAVAAPLALFGRFSLAILCVHLLEDDVFPWGAVLPWLAHDAGAGDMMWIVIFVVRFAVDVLLAWGLYYIPRVNALFFPSRA